MIVVVGSRHDPVAADLIALWPQAALCSAEDLVSPGWVWRHGRPASRSWIVDAKPIRDEDVTGVFIRRSSVYAEELATTHPADRSFLAAEAHAFLSFVLATTSARVVNPVIGGAFGEEALRPERWTAVASEMGIPVRPVRVTSEARRRAGYRTYEVEVVGSEVFGKGPARVLDGALRLAGKLDMAWGVLLFDTRHRLVAATGAQRPGEQATAALRRLLEA
ncbi:MAG TPA: hypothetical protein VE008_01915 [Burkholderiales bacterium]|nr:hypothetical protein [Burkholderiales bacterium]